MDPLNGRFNEDLHGRFRLSVAPLYILNESPYWRSEDNLCMTGSACPSSTDTMKFISCQVPGFSQDSRLNLENSLQKLREGFLFLLISNSIVEPSQAGFNARGKRTHSRSPFLQHQYLRSDITPGTSTWEVLPVNMRQYDFIHGDGALEVTPEPVYVEYFSKFKDNALIVLHPRHT